MQFSILSSPDNRWGDYGDILVHGMSQHLGRNGDGRLQLERTGPYVPPITFPGAGDIIVTQAFRNALEASGLRGISFQPTDKARIVELRWDAWDRSAEEPAEYPKSGEPEDYILGRPHSTAIAESVGELFELDLRPGIQIRREPVQRSRWQPRIVLLRSTWTGVDIFRAEGVGFAYVSERAQDWLTAHAGDHVAFRDAEVE